MLLSFDKERWIFSAEKFGELCENICIHKMNRKQIHTKKELKELRAELRKNLTPAEAFYGQS